MDDLDIKIVRSRRTSISIQVEPSGDVIVKAPKLMPSFIINKFIEKHTGWIEKRVELAKKTARPVRKYENGEIFYFLGKEYALVIGKYAKIEARDGKFLFPEFLKFRIKKEIENWFIAHAKDVITEQAENLAVKMRTGYKSVRLSDTRSKWGSCTHDNRLQFNWRLVMAPILVLRYVVVHELAHTTEKNHGRRFWEKVAEQNPSYKQQRKWLKTYGNTLWA